MRKHLGSPPEVTPQQPAAVITQVREYELITPLFGGGVVPAEADPITIIRGSEIRGHLRFWWRACRGGQYGGNLTAIKQAEDALWGAASTKQGGGPSQVQIEASMISRVAHQAPFAFNKEGKVRPQEDVAPAYAAFPLQPSDKDTRARVPFKTVCSNVSFKLIISFPSARREEVEATLRMWETFGGIGARTRRGFGALRLVSVDGVRNTDLPPSTTEGAVAWIRHQLEQFVVVGTYPQGMPYLTSTSLFKITSSSQNAMDAWGNLIRKLASFRQARNGPRGRSYWPEPEAIRQITGRRYSKHQPLNHPRKFPRAAFGLPIIFHFKDAYKGEPEDQTLQGAQEEKERLASPLILRPLVCKDNRAVGLALLLEGSRIPPPGGIILDSDPTTIVNTQLTPAEARAIPVLQGQTDVLLAFMNYLVRIQ